MIPLTDEEKESYENQGVCYICEKEFCTDEEKEKELKKMQKVRDHCHYTGKYRGAAHSNCNLKYRTTKKIPVVFHNGSTYDYHFIIKHLGREFKYYLRCLGENTEKCITFSVPIKNIMATIKTLKRNMTMVQKLKSNMTMVKPLKNRKAMVKKLKNLKQLHTD